VRASLDGPCALAVGPDGSLYIAEGHRARRVGPDGTISTVAGTGENGSGGDGGPATDAQVSEPSGLAIGPDGSLYIAEGGQPADGPGAAGAVPAVARRLVWSHGLDMAHVVGGRAAARTSRAEVLAGVPTAGRVRRVGTDGVITTVAALGASSALAVAPDGSLYVAESFQGSQVHRVDPDGTVRVIAGTGERGSSGDGGPATAARLDCPSALAIAPDGSLYIAEGGHPETGGCVRRVDVVGTISTLVSGLACPSDLAVTRDGSVYVTESVFVSRVRCLGADGIVTTIVGTGEKGCSGDGGPATSARLECPSALALAPDGSLYVADSLGCNVRRVAWGWGGARSAKQEHLVQEIRRRHELARREDQDPLHERTWRAAPGAHRH